MGGGCSGHSREDSIHAKERLVARRVGNFNFLQYGEDYAETKRVGQGCRRTPAWDCITSPEELQRKRNEFWDTRVEGDPDFWKLLKMACEAVDSESAEAIILAGGLTMPHGTLMVCYDPTGVKYDLPPFIINEPFRFRVKEEASTPTEIRNETYHLTLRSSKYPDMSVIMSSLQHAQHLKEVFSTKNSVPAERLRLFFNGKELKNEMPLGKAKLMNEVVVQVMVS